MRRLACAIVGFCLASAALAQDAPLVFIPTFDAEPSSADLIRRYPPRALERNVSGIAVLCCTPNPDRTVACAVSSDFPAAHGFGEASVQASRAYRLTPESYDDLAARPGTLVRISMLWAGPVTTPETIADLQRRDRETREACLPALELSVSKD